ncbi:DgyrCDS9838 [Dimorphilus gyrociliatus]|uniref:DgyrCDS9838 n=1 Tax=Dimorphilus gyrociliatus TaxID=2664684 RepID=A0A7I8VZT7_9ANNE|nr:DgyrCDS9838 [Dimorphilus gyrociliatus]
MSSKKLGKISGRGSGGSARQQNEPKKTLPRFIPAGYEMDEELEKYSPEAPFHHGFSNLSEVPYVLEKAELCSDDDSVESLAGFSFGNYLQSDNSKERNSNEEVLDAQEFLSPLNRLIHDYKRITGKRKYPENLEQLQEEIGRTDNVTNNEWVRKILEIWGTDRKNFSEQKLTNLLNKCFQEVVNPYSTAIYLFYNALQPGQNRNKYKKYLNRSIQEKAFLFTLKCRVVLHKIVKSFDLANSNNLFLIPHINVLLKSERFVDAAFSISSLKLHSHFDIMEVCLPLLCQDKINVVEKYCARNALQQEQFLKLLDRLCDPRINAFCIPTTLSFSEVTKSDRLQCKSLIKLAIRLAKLFEIDINRCENILNSSKLKALGYLMYRYFVEKSLQTVSNFRDLCESTLEGGSLYLKENFINKLSYYDYFEAAYWTKRLGVTEDAVPQSVWRYVDQIDSDNENNFSDDSINNEDYLNLQISTDRIILISKKHEFLDALRALSKPGNIIGIDAEWRPTLTFSGSSPRMALLQLALIDRVFLFDMLALVDSLDDICWRLFSEKIFLNEQTIKLGFSISGDFTMLVQTIPALKYDLELSKNVVDILTLRDNLTKVAPNFFIQSEQQKYNSNLKGLSELTNFILGKPLNKNEQASNWEKRPLTKRQLYYAALDAHCLIDVYIQLKSACLERGLNFDALHCISIFHFDGQKKTKSQRTRDRFKEKLKSEQTVTDKQVPEVGEKKTEWISPQELRVVVDSMLAGLGRELRKIGIDAMIIENNHKAHYECAEIALKDNRIVLTSGSPFLSLRSQLGEKLVFNIATCKLTDQVNLVVNHFKVKVSIGDIFSRCVICNGDKYMFVRPEQLIKAKEMNDKKKSCEREKSPRLRKYGSIYRTKKEILRAKSKKIRFDELNYESLCVGNGVPIQLNTISTHKLKEVKELYICCTCGKVYWEGVHYADTCSKFSQILNNHKDS